MAGEGWGAPGSLHRRWQGRLPSSQQRVRGLMSPPRDVVRRAGVGGAAASHALPPWSVRTVRLGDPLFLTPCTTGVRGARHAGRDTACWRRRASQAAPVAGMARDGAAGVSVSSWPCLVVVPPTAAGARQRGAPETACPSTGQASASVPGRRGSPGATGGAGRSVGRRGREPGARRWCPFPVRRGQGIHGLKRGSSYGEGVPCPPLPTRTANTFCSP